MKSAAADSPTLTDASCVQRTGRSLAQWFEELDRAGGVAAGRKALVTTVYEATGKDEWWATTIAVEYEKARGAVEKDGRPKGYSICSTRTIAAPLERVFAAFGDAGALDRWLGAGTAVEFADGGCLENADGDRAKFVRIRANKDLRMTWESERLAPGTAVEVLFADKGKGKTGVTLNHTRIQERADADALRAGWAAALADLKSLLERAS